MYLATPPIASMVERSMAIKTINNIANIPVLVSSQALSVGEAGLRFLYRATYI